MNNSTLTFSLAFARTEIKTMVSCNFYLTQQTSASVLGDILKISTGQVKICGSPPVPMRKEPYSPWDPEWGILGRRRKCYMGQVNGEVGGQ